VTPSPQRPPWLVDLPNLNYSRFQDLPAIAHNSWSNGRPLGPMGRVATDAVRVAVLALRRACFICGYPLASGHPVYGVYTTGSPHTRASPSQVCRSREIPERPPVLSARNPGQGYWCGDDNDMYVTGLGPGHLSCAYYAAAVCPFLKYPASVTHFQGEGRDVVRGAAQIAGWGKMGVVFFDEPGLYRRIGLRDIVSQTPLYGGWKDLAPDYEAVVEADAEIIDTSERRLYWTDSPADIRELLTLWRGDEHMAKWAKRVPGAGLKFLTVP
jgi:hypothetical protein